MAAAILPGTLVYTRPIASTTRVQVLVFGTRPAELGPQTARKPLSERAKSSVRGPYPHFPENALAVGKVTDPDKQGPATPPYAAAAATSGRHVTGCPPRKAWEAPRQARKPCAKCTSVNLRSRHVTSPYGILPCKSTRVPIPYFPWKSLWFLNGIDRFAPRAIYTNVNRQNRFGIKRDTKINVHLR